MNANKKNKRRKKKSRKPNEKGELNVKSECSGKAATNELRNIDSKLENFHEIYLFSNSLMRK